MHLAEQVNVEISFTLNETFVCDETKGCNQNT